MAVPEGYVALGLVGFTDRGDYSEDGIYMQNDLVHRNNAIWKCNIDNTTGIEPAENDNWTIFVQSQTDLAGISATDTQGMVTGEGEVVVAQELLDAIADRVANKLLEKSKMSNVQVNDETMVPTSALVYAMQQAITNLNSKTHELKHGSFTGTTDSNGNIYPQFEQNIHIISSIAVDRIAIPFLDGSWKTDFHIMNYDGTPASSLETTAYYWYFDA